MQSTLIPAPHLLSGSTGRYESLASLVAGLTQPQQPEQEVPVIQMQQLHGAEIAILDSQDPYTLSHSDSTFQLPGVDGVLTDQPNRLLTVRTADCVPILLYHASGVIGALHAGRKGTEKRILEKALTTIQTHWGITGDLSVWIGPHICEQCYQVDRTTDLHYNLLGENLRQLHAIFSPDKVRVFQDERCTAHTPTELYSYRREGAGVHMNYSGILLRS